MFIIPNRTGSGNVACLHRLLLGCYSWRIAYKIKIKTNKKTANNAPEKKVFTVCIWFSKLPKMVCFHLKKMSITPQAMQMMSETVKIYMTGRKNVCPILWLLPLNTTQCSDISFFLGAIFQPWGEGYHQSINHLKGYVTSIIILWSSGQQRQGRTRSEPLPTLPLGHTWHGKGLLDIYHVPDNH